MKTILTIDSYSYLIPNGTDLNKVLEILRGITPVHGQYTSGVDNFESREVLADRPAKMKVELVHDEDVCTREEWEKIKEAVEVKNKRPEPKAMPEPLSRS